MKSVPKRMLQTFTALVLTLITGTLGLVWTEHLSFWQAFYLTVETITTVGYGDIKVHSIAGHIFLIFLMLGGVGVALYFASFMMAFVIEGQLADVYGRRKMNKRIAELHDHVIVCGAGRVGKQVILRLRKEGVSYIIIEQKEELVKELINDGYLALEGDASQDDILKKVHIERAKGLVTAMPDDALNVFVTLTAKGMNPGIHVVARMDKLESEKKLLRAGADKVISPAILGGSRMAMSIVKPVSVDYIDTVIHGHDIRMEIEEFSLDEGSCLVGKTLVTSGIKEQTGAIVLAIVRENQVISNPNATEMFLSGDLLIVLGLREQLQRLEEVAASRGTLNEGIKCSLK